ncbi:uncharacterized protein LY89DRAFT_648147 [Mollisia scopiformis]|uniref:CHAT domain-containing protein n=1 Tax=Mollisia scopiformis TaxID=149040 RepID=A0A194X8B0_MOLSC|nr:uncharacterized protein LY89DRAFT_648147 [Mollisia scopiformis]KUJ16027.1 hypothetical protein LY89DRAFT_648147 [Mollisia scopiformis]
MCAKRFERSGYGDDIDRAIEYAEKALKCSETMNVEEKAYLKGRLMRNVAIKLEMRDQRLSSIRDLNAAISMMGTAITLVNEDNPDWALFNGELGNMKASRFRRTKEITTDLDEAIEKMESALALLPKHHPNKSHLLCDLGDRYLDRYQRLHGKEDLEKSIKISRKSHDIREARDPDRGKPWCSMVCKYVIRAQDFPNRVNIATAISATRHGPKLPEGDPLEMEALERLGDAIMAKHNYNYGIDHRYCDKGIDKYAEAIQVKNGPPLTTIRIAKKIAEYSMRFSRERIACINAARIYTHVIKVVWPRLNPRTLSRDDMEFVIRHLSGLSSLAAVSVMKSGKSASDALVALESGRGLMASLTIDSRSDVSALKEQHADLYKRYMTLQDEISSNISLGSEPEKSAEESTTVAISQRNRKVREFDKLAEEIRSLEGFEHFQQPLPHAELVSLAEFGPIVCFNTTSQRCDAFLVTRNGIQCLELSAQYDKIQEFVIELVRKKEIFASGNQSQTSERNQRLREILAELWKLAVEPVLSCLGLISNDPPAKLPRIWWVTSGPMGLLPLHAAGSNWGNSRENTASHVVSSYVPTFRALAYARQKMFKSLLEPSRECLIVSMPETEGLFSLDVAKEVKAVQKHLESQGNTVSSLEIPLQKEVRSKLQSASIVHFACHGESNALNPSCSGLRLAGKDLLRVRDLAAMSLDQAQIAYLSACSTADNSVDDQLVEESIHVASAFQLVGFPHVIGSLWPVSNKIAEIVAPKFYESLAKHLQAGENNNDAIAYALDDAVKNWRRGRKTERFISWCPFIHIGA